MPQATAAVPAAATIGASALHIVLFGMSGAGKSSLLGALAQAVQTHEQALNYRLVGPSPELTELQSRVYQNRPEPTVEETVSYPLVLEPFRSEGAPEDPPEEIVLVDSGGKAADGLLARRDPLRPDSDLARAVLDADTLILVVDGSASAARLERDFGEFSRFLDLLETSRALRSDVAGLPVYLVSTKCDQLAQKEDTSLAWIDRIEERKLQIGERFRDFLARQATTQPRPFGSIDLHLWATSVRRPPLIDSQANPDEPYGVAELFRQCVDSARVFHDRETRAGAKLRKTVIGSIGVLGILAALAVVLSLTRPGGEMSTLELRVDHVHTQEHEQSESKKYRMLKPRIEELQSIRGDPGFASLPPAQREYVTDLLRRLTHYRKVSQEYEKKLKGIRPPEGATSREQLDEIEDRLHRLVPPANYEGNWSETPVGQVREQWLKDIELIRNAVADVRKWYYRAFLEGEKLLNTGSAATLPARAKEFLEKTRPWFPEREPDKPLSRQTDVPFKTVLDFDTVASIRERWDEKKRELQILASRAKG
jgi:energy-coupling factor transporter ATP-binding protein EcfA2